MKKIMFDDNYGLTQAVIELRKTNTRRVCKEFRTGGIIYAKDVESIGMYSDENLVEFVMKDGSVKVSVPRYKVGEVVAVEQSYKDLVYTKEWVEQHIKPNPNSKTNDPFEKKYPGWSNKMFVRADLMPHQIRITDIKVERLQDISDEDCLREGILHSDKYAMPYGITEVTAPNGVFFYYSSSREAFADLIDKVSGNGTWDCNPWVFAYTFELVK